LAISPLLLLCACAVRWFDGPPVIFRQTRVGAEGRPFTILKFRTMHAGTPGPQLTASGDPRITRLGRSLRRFKLDELPQLLNVFLGEMSLVGPRPELPAYADQHAAVYRRLGRMRPGITDWASLAFRDEEALLARNAGIPDFYVAVLLPRKLALARLYRRHASAWLDLRLVLATVFAACRMEALMGAFAGNPVHRAWDAVARSGTPSTLPLQEMTLR
jgi:lipopolysaccharide/colanic/teichoic acid biosynthesis glycosyltransferase